MWRTAGRAWRWRWPKPRPPTSASGAPWERQTLLRARGVVGDPDLLRRALSIATRAAYEGGEPSPSDMHHLRTRLEKDLKKAHDEIARFDAKLGNEQFVAKAPEEVLTEQREKRAEAIATAARLTEAVGRLA